MEDLEFIKSVVSSLSCASNHVLDALSGLESDARFTTYAVELWQLERKLIAFKAGIEFHFNPQGYLK